MITPLYNFINDRLVDGSAVLRPLSWHLILYVFRYFSRKWKKISDCECPDLIQNETFCTVLRKMFVLIGQNLHGTVTDVNQIDNQILCQI